MKQKTLFVKIGGDYQWTQTQLENLVEDIDEVTDDGVQIIATPDEVEYLSQEQVEAFGKEIMEAADADE